MKTKTNNENKKQVIIPEFLADQPWPGLKLNSVEVTLIGRALQSQAQMIEMEAQSQAMFSVAQPGEDATEEQRKAIMQKAFKEMKAKQGRQQEAAIVLMAKLIQYRNRLREFEIPDEPVVPLDDTKAAQTEQVIK